jgi:outer membrane lipoprotein
MPRLAALCAICLVFMACATTPPPLAGGPYATVDHRAALDQAARGERVRWGGTIVVTTPDEEETCFEIIDHPLDGQGRPRQTDQTAGRFMACAPGFFDPGVYRLGREVTVVGVLAEPRTGKIGDHTYQYPRAVAEIVYLWPERVEDVWRPYYPDPFWYPYWYHPYYYRPWWP